jgi:hypothetical protein
MKKPVEEERGAQLVQNTRGTLVAMAISTREAVPSGACVRSGTRDGEVKGRSQRRSTYLRRKCAKGEECGRVRDSKGNNCAS